MYLVNIPFSWCLATYFDSWGRNNAFDPADLYQETYLVVASSLQYTNIS